MVRRQTIQNGRRKLRQSVPQRTVCFLDLFQDKKNLLKLYKTLHPEDTEATEDIINQYIISCKVFDEQRKLYGMTEQTVRETIRICKDRNVLKEYLMNREVEVVTIEQPLVK